MNNRVLITLFVLLPLLLFSGSIAEDDLYSCLRRCRTGMVIIMSDHMKRRIPVLILIGLITLLCCGSAAAVTVESGSCGKNVTYTLDDQGKLIIKGSGRMTSAPWPKEKVKKAVIKSGVTSICREAFSSAGSMTSVTIPETVNRIGDSAFNECRSLEKVTLPSGLTRIDRFTFMECTSLTELSVPEGVISIGRMAFSNCVNLKKLMLPEGLAYIEDGACAGCEMLENVTLPQSLMHIGRCAFLRCSSLTGILLPEGITVIEGSMFRECIRLKEVTIPAGVTVIEQYAFAGCESLTDVVFETASYEGTGHSTSDTFPGGVAHIRTGAFSECRSLTGIELPPSLYTIGECAFDDTNLKNTLTIPDGTKQIGDRAFYTSSLTKAVIPRSVTEIGKECFTCGVTICCYPSSAAEIWAAEHENTIRYIEQCASACSHSVVSRDRAVAPNYARTGLTEGSHCAVCGAVLNPQQTIPALKDLRVLKLSPSVEVIEEEAFAGLNCEALIISGRCRSIKSRAFANCGKLRCVMLESASTAIAEDAFAGCGGVVLCMGEEEEPLETTDENLIQIQSLKEKTIRQANLLLEDELIFDGLFYSNPYFSVSLDNQDRIESIWLKNGRKYSLFNIQIGDSVDVSVDRAGKYPSRKWRLVKHNMNGYHLKCDTDPDWVLVFNYVTNPMSQILEDAVYTKMIIP